MSGGFFRGTSAEQDTRFSNKQAKLLKSQKFAPELEHLVDMTKVKMDVIRPWIATRVTELLGFEDEVLINFIYGLLDGKEVNGKEVQISLTGFMEKNTGKFMKELWILLLSAQKNSSGVPQQFLDAKEEETKKKKAEADRIANEIQKKRDKESREHELEKLRKMDGGVEPRRVDGELEPSSKHRGSGARLVDERDADERNGVQKRTRSPHSADHSPLRGSRSRSLSKSFSNSRSYTDDRNKSRSMSRSRSPRRQHRAVSSDRMKRSPRRRSVTPRSRYSSRVSRSPSRRRPSYSRRRSMSRSPRRSVSPVLRRVGSPYKHGSPSIRRHRSPIRYRRSPSPYRRRRSRSPARRRSPLVVRRRSPPVHHWSSSPSRRRFPLPVCRSSRSPIRHRSSSSGHGRTPSPRNVRSSPPRRRYSPSPIHHRRQRTPSTPRRRSPSPVRHRPPAVMCRNSKSTDSRSTSPSELSSHSPVGKRSSKQHGRSMLQSPRSRHGMHEEISPVAHSMTLLKRDSNDRNKSPNREAVLSSPEKSPSVSRSPSNVRQYASKDGRSSSSPNEGPVMQKREQMARSGSLSPKRKSRDYKTRSDSSGASKDNEEVEKTRHDGYGRSRSSHTRYAHSSFTNKQKGSPRKVHSPEKLVGSWSTEARSRLDSSESRIKILNSEKSSETGAHPENLDLVDSPTVYNDASQVKRQNASLQEGKRYDEKSHSRFRDVKDGDKYEKAQVVSERVEKVDHDDQSFDSGSEDSNKHRTKHKKKHKRSHRREVSSDGYDSYDSEIEDRKEAKRRRKEEKRQRKEEKRRRREERRSRREERRAAKLKSRDQDDSSASDGKMLQNEDHPSDDEETESQKKKLEIELRKKALQSFNAKKGINH